MITKKPKCKLTGTDGNVFALMGKVSRTLKETKLPDQAKEMVSRVVQSHSYGEALAIMQEYVEVS